MEALVGNSDGLGALSRSRNYTAGRPSALLVTAKLLELWLLNPTLTLDPLHNFAIAKKDTWTSD